MENRGTIIQYGSGRPGEEDSAAFEQALFRELGLADPGIVFIPFHGLMPGENDWTRFLEIYRPLTRAGIELFELPPFERHPHIERLLRKLRDARVIVLGSGLVEPYIAAIVASDLHHILADLHHAGTVFIGYSAGTLALGAEFRFYQTGEELLNLLEELLATALKQFPVADAAAGFCEVFQTPPQPEELLELLERRRVSGRASVADEPFFTKMHAMAYCPGLELVPNIAAYPHFGEPQQCQLEHLRLLRSEHPKLLHVGVPNAMAIVTTFGPEGHRMLARGRNHRHKLTWIDATGLIRTCADREEIPSL